MSPYLPSDLPSYHEATSKVDWWPIVGPYVLVSDYTRLCLVSRKVYGLFAPRLWNDPLHMVQLLGLDRHDELGWYLHRFIGRSVRAAKLPTRCLVLSLDFSGGFASATADFLSDTVEDGFNRVLRQLPLLFPKLRCILLDGHPVLDPTLLGRETSASSSSSAVGDDAETPLLLSMVDCRTELPASYFASTYMKNLVYLDVSYLRGSLKASLGQGLFGPRTLPNLRVLKVRGRELDDSTAISLAAAFQGQLWSLDVSDNNLTDRGILGVLAHTASLPTPERRPRPHVAAETHFDVEGKLLITEETGTTDYGPFVTLVESEWSATSSHPHRYFADPPTYRGGGGEDGTLQGSSDHDHHQGVSSSNLAVRSDGTARVLRDDARGMLRLLAGGAGSLAPEMLDVVASRPCHRGGRDGLTHLSMNGNRLTLAGVERAIRSSCGAFEHLECDMPLMMRNQHHHPWLPSSPSSRRPSRIYGFLGASHLLRPVVSSNLRSARLHHSLVTLTPTLVTAEEGGVASMADDWAAEVLLLPRAEVAYPQPFTPDMNPRMSSLTLTNIPRRSTGAVVGKLICFLQLAYEQERLIRAVTVSGWRRSPSMLKGLRHLRLEFEPDLREVLECLPSDDGDDGGGGGDDATAYDPGSVMDEPPSEFSFFGEWKPSSPTPKSQLVLGKAKPASGGAVSALSSGAAESQQSGRIQSFPFHATLEGEGGEGAGGGGGGGKEEYVDQVVDYNDRRITVPVWVGSGTLELHPAVNNYMKNLAADASLRTAIAPATPCQVLAGAPLGSNLFQAAWAAMLGRPLTPQEALRRPSRAELARVKDVVSELKLFRAEARAAGRHWTGKLEVVCKDSTAYFHSSQFWR